MKRKSWLLFSAFVSTGLLAQQPPSPNATNAPAPVIETPAASPALTNTAAANTNTPAAPANKKKKQKKATKHPAQKKDAASELRSVPLVTGPAIVIASNVNVRGQAGLKGEVVARLAKDQPVTVLDEITLKKSAPDEPSAWAKILLPTNTHVWV